MKPNRKFKLGNIPWDEVTGNCGIGVLFDFYEHGEDDDWDPDVEFDKEYFAKKGTGFFVTAFIKNQMCLDTYAYFKKNCQITYQSPVRKNNNTNRDFFFVVLDLRAEKVNNRKYKWPLGE